MIQIFVSSMVRKFDYITDFTKSIYISYVDIFDADYIYIPTSDINIHDFKMNDKYLTDNNGIRYPAYFPDGKEKDVEFISDLRLNIYKLINNIETIKPFAYGMFNSVSNTLITLGVINSTLKGYQLDTVVMIDSNNISIPYHEFILFQDKDFEKVEKFMRSIKDNNMTNLIEIRSYCMDNQSNKTIDNINLEG